MFRMAVGRRRPSQPSAVDEGRETRVTRETFLTVRWNNLLMLSLGIPTLILVVVAFSTSSWSGRGALIALSILGGFF